MENTNQTVEYRDIIGYPGYRIGSDGSVWTSWITCRSGRVNKGKWKRLKPNPGSKGYLRINLTPVGGKFKTFRVHRLVLEAFTGPCPDGMEGRHLNGVKADCQLSNLQWGTPEQNRQDNHNLEVYEHGENHTQAILTEQQVVEIRRRYATGELMRVLAAEHGVSVPNVSAIINRKSWKHVA